MAFNFGSTSGNNSTAPAPAPAGTGFTFGAPKDSNNGGSTPAFSFGATAPAESSAPAAASGGAFSFSSAPAPATTEGKPTFGFGAASTDSKPAVSFGSQPESSATDDSKKTTTFSFGSAPDATATTTETKTAVVPAFGSTQTPTTAPPAAAGGFTFGGFNASASASSAPGKRENDETSASGDAGKTSSRSPPAPAGFSFGGGGAPAPSAGANLFGGNTGTSTTPTTPTVGGKEATSTGLATPGAPAPVDTPATTNKRASRGETTPKPTAAEPPAIEYQTLTVEQILNKFQKELEHDSIFYLEQAKRVCEYDAVLRDSQRDLTHLTSQAQRLLLEQESVEQALLGIGAFQDQLESTLGQVETQVDELFRSQSRLAPENADVERERSYQLASEVDLRLEGLSERLQATTLQLSNANSKMFSGDIGHVVTVLNEHQNSLARLEGAARKLEADVTRVGGLLTSGNS